MHDNQVIWPSKRATILSQPDGSLPAIRNRFTHQQLRCQADAFKWGKNTLSCCKLMPKLLISDSGS